MAEIRGEHGPELVNLPGGSAVRPRRHLRPVAAVFARSNAEFDNADDAVRWLLTPSRAARAWALLADVSVMVAALVCAGWLDWREERRARRWEP